MLEDRDYMRQPAYHEPRISCTVAILIVNAVVFLTQQAANSPHGNFVQYNYFALSLDGIKSGYVWQFLTFQFMHAGWMHIIFNSLAIYFFGRPVETVLGRARFLTLYLVGGIIGGCVQMLFALAFPTFGGAVVGASAGASALVAAFAVLHWEERFTILLYFIPLTMRGRTLLWALLVLTLIGIAIPSHVANAAHLGGILTGFFYVRQIFQGRWHFPQFRFPSRRIKPREFVAAGNEKNKFWQAAKSQPDDDLSADEFLKNEVDPILDKISAQGIHSLTAGERKILEKARAKMTKR